MLVFTVHYNAPKEMFGFLGDNFMKNFVPRIIGNVIENEGIIYSKLVLLERVPISHSNSYLYVVDVHVKENQLSGNLHHVDLVPLCKHYWSQKNVTVQNVRKE